MRFARPVRRTLTGVGVATAGVGAYLAVATGRLTSDLDVGRRRQMLGPLDVVIEAPREVVYAVISEPYLGRTPRAMSAKLRVVDRGVDMVVAEHLTTVSSWLVATTLEAVHFSPHDRVDFRLLRGPVPSVIESFQLEATAARRTDLHYEGTLETDLWQLGVAWGRLVARHWTTAVSLSLESIKSEAERRAARGASASR